MMNMHNSLFWHKERQGRSEISEAMPDNLKEREAFLTYQLSYSSNMASWYANRQHDEGEMYRYLGRLNAAIDELSAIRIERSMQVFEPFVWTLE